MGKKKKHTNKTEVLGNLTDALENTNETVVLDNKENDDVETEIMDIPEEVRENQTTENDIDEKEDTSEIVESVNKDTVSQDVMANLGLKTNGDIRLIETRHIKVIVITALKVLLPVAALAILMAILFSVTKTKKVNEIEEVAIVNTDVESSETPVTLPEEPLGENDNESVNSLMNSFYNALANGDVETIKTLKDYCDQTELITYEKKSEFIESYNNINCYTKTGIEDNSYFVYVSYDVKIKGIDTAAPGLNAYYVYTDENNNLIIDGNMEENIEAALKLVTSQDDVVDLYMKVDVSYNEAITSDENLNTFLTELPTKIKTSVGEALARIEAEESAETATETVPEETSQEEQTEEILQDETVKQIVKATDTVNVRTSDSEEADKIGSVVTGTELERVQIKINGWSKVIYDGKEAYIKSDYLEVVSEENISEDNTVSETPAVVGANVKATTNVNVRNKPNQTADAIGTAQANKSYKLLEDLGDWYKIDYLGQTGYVKAEYFVND